MTSPERPTTSGDGSAAWLAVAAALRETPAPPEPEANLLAAWLEGRLDEAEAAPVETWIAREPAVAAERIALLREALAAESPTAEFPAAPQRLLLRLRALGPRQRPSARPAPLHRLLPQAAGMAAAMLLAVFGAYGGYEMGLRGALAAERAEMLIAETALADLAIPADDFFLD